MKDYADLEAALRAALTAGDVEAAQGVASEIDGLPVAGPVSTLAAALYYAQEGLPVFPLSPGSKIPHKGTRGCKDATTDETTIRAWWDRWPDSNLGLATGHVVDVVDFDGPAAHAAWGVKYGNTWADLTVLGTVATPRPGGLHLYVPANPAVGNGAGLLPGVDYRGRGGYVVAPPSRTEVGTYRWVRPLDPTTHGAVA